MFELLGVLAEGCFLPVSPRHGFGSSISTWKVARNGPRTRSVKSKLLIGPLSIECRAGKLSLISGKRQETMGDSLGVSTAGPLTPPAIQVTGLAPDDHDISRAISSSEAGEAPPVSATTLAAPTTPNSPGDASTSNSGPSQPNKPSTPKEVVSAQSSMASLQAIPDPGPPAGFDGGRRRSSVSRFLASIFNPGDRRGSKDSVSDKSMLVETIFGSLILTTRV
jgi:hypothetical protein